MRLIDSEGSFTINATDNTGYSLAFGGGIISCADKFGHIEAEFFADDAPAVDAVLVVRCKDCKNWHTTECALDYAMFEPTDDSFCSYGERKDGDTDGS